MTDTGDRFIVTTTIPAIYIAPLPWHYLARNADATGPNIEAPSGDRRAYSISKPHPWRQKRAEDPAYFKYYNSRYGAAESEAEGWFTAACGPMIYHDRVLPGLHGQYFVCEPAGNLIHRARIVEEASALKIERVQGEEKSEFAASSDTWSHPMNLTHGPDGSIWVVDYYREIIEDYSAIPRHLQQQYGVYNGHDRGRIYRLTHPDAKPASASDMNALDATTLAKECGSPLLWRRQTAQRLLVERGEKAVASTLRELLADKNAEADTLITTLRTLDQLRVLAPANVQPFIRHANDSVRIHALQLSEQWFGVDEGKSLLTAVLDAAEKEQNPRGLIQFALTLGETRDPRAVALLVRFAREQLSIRWMDAAILSSLHDRGLEMLRELTANEGAPEAFVSSVAQMISARRDDGELADALTTINNAEDRTKAAVLNGLAKGRKNAPRKRLQNKEARAAFAVFAASSNTEVRRSVRALEETFSAEIADEETTTVTGKLPDVQQISDETFRRYVSALTGPRDLKRGHELYVQACAICHRIGNEGHDVGPDLIGQLGIAEEALLKDVLMPNDRIRPGFETTVVQLSNGGSSVGILKDDGATSLTVMQPSGAEQMLLRKDVTAVRRVANSLMPSFVETLKPADAADLVGWLRSNLGPQTQKPDGKKKIK
jgi:putative heme-binding domain-containing protein